MGRPGSGSFAVQVALDLAGAMPKLGRFAFLSAQYLTFATDGKGREATDGGQTRVEAKNGMH